MPSPVILLSLSKECALWFNLWFHAPKIEEMKVHIQQIMLYEFNKNTTKTTKKNSSVNCQGVITDCQNFVLAIYHWEMNLNQNIWKELVECNPSKSTSEFALDLNALQTTICNHLKKTGKVYKMDIWIPHILSEKNKENHISIATSLLSRQRNGLFFKNIITSDKNKSVFYENILCKV